MALKCDVSKTGHGWSIQAGNLMKYLGLIHGGCTVCLRLLQNKSPSMAKISPFCAFAGQARELEWEKFTHLLPSHSVLVIASAIFQARGDIAMHHSGN